jgi:hypothetical protein
MASEEHVAILRQGAEAWNTWRRSHPGAEPDLANANLIEVDLRGAQLRSANLSGTHLRGADLREADLAEAGLFRANLAGARMEGARLYWADLIQTGLERADLRDADLRGADFSGAHLAEANLAGAILEETTFANVDLSRVLGLADVRHRGPSTIGIDTVFRSRGKIPEGFLRGAGVPEPFIAGIPALIAATNPFQFYSCFISYATADQDFAERLYAGLQEKGVRCWFAPHDIQGGRKIYEQIDEAIGAYDKLLLVLSVASMESEWVRTEVAEARRRQMREGRRMLFPIRLVRFERLREWKAFDADTGKDSAREVREYFIPDFTCWKDRDGYRAALQRLLHDLEAGRPGESGYDSRTLRLGEDG